MRSFNGERSFSLADIEQKRREKLRDELFSQLIAGKVLDDFDDDLICSEMPEVAIEGFNKAFRELSEEDKRAVLAIPAQLRPIQFGKYARRVLDGELTGAEVVADILAKAERYGYTLGFHLSLYDIPRTQDGSWYVRGTEPDHRHDDMPMAYYSMDYSNRYRDKRTTYLYVIRAETGESTSHYRDNDGTWGHASSLAIISQVKLDEIEKELDERFKEVENGKGGDADGAPPHSVI